MSVIGVIEIATRNYVCHHLDLTFQSDDWLFNPPSPFQWKPNERKLIQKSIDSAKRAKYQILSQKEKHDLDILAFPKGIPANHSHFEVIKKRQKAIDIEKGQVIAQLTLYFWKRLFSEDYEQILWKRSLKKIFPNKKLDRPIIANYFEILYQARNRIAHHEPIYGTRLDDTITSIKFISENFAVRFAASDTPLAKFLYPHQMHLNNQIIEFNKAWTALTGK